MLNQQYLKAVYKCLAVHREGTPRTVLEAMQGMGRPIITTDALLRKETVKDGINGYIVKVKSSQALVKAMFSFIEQPELIESMGNNSRKIAEDKYDVDKVNKHMMLEMDSKSKTIAVKNKNLSIEVSI